jgi:hypothetical protein
LIKVCYNYYSKENGTLKNEKGFDTMEKISIYKTFDGEIFETEKSAKEHEENLEVENAMRILSRYCGNKFYCENCIFDRNGSCALRDTPNIWEHDFDE